MTSNNLSSATKGRTKRVLSIQSHVAHGYVGNKAATFTLQYKGWNVDALNTVQFSNHPGYEHFSGFSSNPDELIEIISEGLLAGLELRYDAILTGYIPDIEGLIRVGRLLHTICERDQGIKWVLDPVLGDNGRLYVAEGNVEVYKDIIKTSHIYMVTPNKFEMELLTGITIKDLRSLKESFETFKQLYPLVQNLVVTSVELPENNKTLISASGYLKTDDLYIDAIEVPIIPARFSGSGDLFSALLLNEAFSLKNDLTLVDKKTMLKNALERTVALVDSILKRTYELTLKDHEIKTDGITIVKDLKLIQSRDLLAKDKVPSTLTFKSFSI